MKVLAAVKVTHVPTGISGTVTVVGLDRCFYRARQSAARQFGFRMSDLITADTAQVVTEYNPEGL